MNALYFIGILLIEVKVTLSGTGSNAESIPSASSGHAFGSVFEKLLSLGRSCFVVIGRTIKTV